MPQKERTMMGRRVLLMLLASVATIVVAMIVTLCPSTRAQRASGAAPSSKLEADLRRVETEVDEAEAAALAKVSGPLDPYAQRTLLGKLIIFDKHLSVKQNQACASCHMSETGFTGPIDLVNRTTVAYPGSVHSRYSDRKPQSYGYATLSPVLHYDANAKDFVGGNFWDMRATGTRLGNPAAAQAQGPPSNPSEMGQPDSACMVYRLSQRPYRTFFEKLWGHQAFSIKWPSDIDQVCSTPATKTNGTAVKFASSDREVASRTFDYIALSLAAYESSPEVNAFSSKFDAYLGGKVQLTPEEQAGFTLFKGKAGCTACHTATGTEPLFTDYTSSNLGVPKNTAIPYYKENTPDQDGYTANPAGKAYIDNGVGHFLASKDNRNSDWKQYESQFAGKFQVATLRNVDKRPSPDFVKAYMHNGYFKSLKEVVHFYNTRDTLPRCGPKDLGEKVTCWPAPEVSQNLDKTQLGNLHLTEQEENEIVAFLTTLSDGYNAKP